MTQIRRHSIIVSHDDYGRITGLQLEKDWYDRDFAHGYNFRVIEDRPQGQFHFLSFRIAITQTQASLFTDNIIRGKIVVIALSDYSMQTLYSKWVRAK